MAVLNAPEVRVKLDLDIHEDEVRFVFPAPPRDWDCLNIARSNEPITTPLGSSHLWISRRMPVHSGGSGIESLLLQRNEVSIVFTPELAESLELEREVSIVFDSDQKTFQQLRFALSRFFQGSSQYSDQSKGQ